VGTGASFEMVLHKTLALAHMLGVTCNLQVIIIHTACSRHGVNCQTPWTLSCVQEHKIASDNIQLHGPASEVHCYWTVHGPLTAMIGQGDGASYVCDKDTTASNNTQAHRPTSEMHCYWAVSHWHMV
jgi:hypothetical protein